MALFIAFAVVSVIALAVIIVSTGFTHSTVEAQPEEKPAFVSAPLRTVSTTPTFVQMPSPYSLGSDKKLVIALDPGHGAEDTGASAFGIHESDVTWRIAKYCEQVLRRCPDVEVVLTRGENENPSFEERTQTALAAHADIVVSIHVNEGEDPSYQGAIVFYPNETSTWLYDQTVPVSRNLSSLIMTRLGRLGLKENGIKSEVIFEADIDEGERSRYMYGDGSGVSDYYAPIREARKAGLPAVLVEHAFLTNEQDASRLRFDSFLQALGESDAYAILECFGFVVADTVAPLEPRPEQTEGQTDVSEPLPDDANGAYDAMAA